MALSFIATAASAASAAASAAAAGVRVKDRGVWRVLDGLATLKDLREGVGASFGGILLKCWDGYTGGSQVLLILVFSKQKKAVKG